MIVAEAFVVPWGGAAAEPLPVPPAASAEAGVASVSSLRGIAFLERIADLSSDDAAAAFAASPDAVRALAVNPPAAEAVASWWASAPNRARGAAISAIPSLIGNLQGVPFTARDIVNRSVLETEQEMLTAALAGGVGRAERTELSTRLHMLDQIELALAGSEAVPVTADLPRQLLALDTEGEGRAVVAVGDITEADFVSYLIPGMFFGVDAQLGSWTDAAAALAAEQQTWLDRLQPDADLTVAVVAWIGYRTPTLVNVASTELAQLGSDALTASIEGLRAARGDDQPYLSILAHSYGSTAALLSLDNDPISVDALAMVGSPGSTADSVADLNVTNGNVWVGAAEWDPIPASGVFGSQPLSPSYGAQRFSVAAGVDPFTGDTLAGATSHNDYFAAHGTSMRNLALIAIGAGEQVTAADQSAGDASARAMKRRHRSI